MKKSIREKAMNEWLATFEENHKLLGKAKYIFY
jgi:hypothetical protein